MNADEVKKFHDKILNLKLMDMKKEELLEELGLLHISILDYLSMLAPHKRPFVLDQNNKQKIKMKKNEHAR